MRFAAKRWRKHSAVQASNDDLFRAEQAVKVEEQGPTAVVLQRWAELS